MDTARIFVVDDHPLVREGLALTIGRHPGLSICGESGEVDDAFSRIKEQQPDLVLIDLFLYKSSGIDLIHRVNQAFPHIKLIAISMYDEEIYGQLAKQAGALGYINKREISGQVIDAVVQVLSGKTHFNRVADKSRQAMESLSKRESEVFNLIAQGLTMTEIARQLFISVKTVEAHREKIKNKLGLESSHELTVYASRIYLPSSN